MISSSRKFGVALALFLGGFGAACAPQPRAPAGPSVPPDYAALPDTLVCVVDRSSPTGLREIQGKVGADGVVLFVDGQVRPLEAVHPVGMIAGYAGREGWLTRGDPLTVDGVGYTRTGGERRIGAELLRRAGDFQGFLVFAGVEDPRPADAVYVPTAPGCIFQAYVRADLIRR